MGGKNDGDNEMRRMRGAIAGKLERAHIEVEQTNLDDGKNLPRPNGVAFNQVWFCGHSRFVEANRSIRKSSARDLGGFSIKEIAVFVNACVTRGKNKVRLICCESAQEQRYTPRKIGNPPADLPGVLGRELLQALTEPILNKFNTDIDARITHLEGLILAMAELWRVGKSEQPELNICGLWGAGDITDDDVPITSFLQDGGSLEAQAKMNDQKLSGNRSESPTQPFSRMPIARKRDYLIFSGTASAETF